MASQQIGEIVRVETSKALRELLSNLTSSGLNLFNPVFEDNESKASDKNRSSAKIA